ncbi:MAG: hypothetical protein WBF54_08925 [Terriglobales bacterium]
MSLKRWSLLVLLALCTWGAWWFLSRAWALARDTADQSHARAYIKRVDEAQKGFLKDNPGQGFACKLDDLRRAGLASPSESKYNFELHCDKRERLPQTEYLVVGYPADKRVKGEWGFWVFCSDQTDEIWGELSREDMRNNLSESEKAGLYDFEGICRRNHRSSRR